MVLSCDIYSDIWPVYFSQFNKYWPDYDGMLFLNTEKISDIPIDLNKYNISLPVKSFPSDTPWAKRLFLSLQQIEEDFVLLVLDDFIFTDYVDVKEIDRCLNYMVDDKEIVCFNFRPTRGKSIAKDYVRYELKDRGSEFRINLQAAIWRKSFLLKFIRVHENPWQFETWGSIRARRYKEKIYHIREEATNVFYYPMGGIIADRKWRGLESVKLLKDLGYDYLIPNRDIYYPGTMRKTEIKHRTFVQKVFQVILSLI